jgi:hypothetical protein
VHAAVFGDSPCGEALCNLGLTGTHHSDFRHPDEVCKHVQRPITTRLLARLVQTSLLSTVGVPGALFDQIIKVLVHVSLYSQPKRRMFVHVSRSHVHKAQYRSPPGASSTLTLLFKLY